MKRFTRKGQINTDISFHLSYIRGMGKSDNNLQQLRKDIVGLLAQVDEEGLFFLKKQASTIIYNQTVLEMNKKNQESLLENHEAKQEDKKGSKAKKNRQAERDIYVDMSGEAKGFCNVIRGNIRVFFTLDELGTMVYIAEKAARSGDAGLLLFRWLKKERGDFLVENGIKNYPSSVIDKLAEYLAENRTKSRKN
jgi:regulator of replication initiation timing